VTAKTLAPALLFIAIGCLYVSDLATVLAFYDQDQKPADIDVPLLWVGKKPVIEAKIEGQGPFSFFFDTGAQGAVIDEALAKDLKLPVVGEGKVASPGGKGIPSKQVRFNADIGGTKLADLTAMSFDRSKLFPDPKSPRGVLSAKMFSGHLLTLDFAKNRLTVRPGELPEADGKTIFKCDNNEPIPTIWISLGGKEVEVCVDTGAPGGLSLPFAVAERLPLDGKPVEIGRGRRVDREIVIYGAKLKGQARIGSLVLENPELRLEESKFERGILGMEILRKFDVTYDAKNGRLRLIEADARK
jgi:predicted aspartyl protease